MCSLLPSNPLKTPIAAVAAFAVPTVEAAFDRFIHALQQRQRLVQWLESAKELLVTLQSSKQELTVLSASHNLRLAYHVHCGTRWPF